MLFLYITATSNLKDFDITLFVLLIPLMIDKLNIYFNILLDFNNILIAQFAMCNHLSHITIIYHLILFVILINDNHNIIIKLILKCDIYSHMYNSYEQ